jgi:hypothetical protein
MAEAFAFIYLGISGFNEFARENKKAEYHVFFTISVFLSLMMIRFISVA